MHEVDGSPRVTIVEDHGLIAQTVAAALRARGREVDVLDPLALREELADALLASAADLVLLDLDLGDGRSSLPLIPSLAEAGVPVLMVTGIRDEVRLAECVEAGAVGVLDKSTSFDALLAAIEQATATGTLLTAEQRDRHRARLRTHREAERARLAPFASLTPREAFVLGELMRGRSVDAIATAAFVSVATVRTQVRAILAKLGVSSQLSATAKANEAGWQPPTSPG